MLLLFENLIPYSVNIQGNKDGYAPVIKQKENISKQ